MLIIGFCVVLFLIGTMLCFFGVQLYRLWFGLVGLLTGILAGYQLGPVFFGNTGAGLILALVLGLVFALFFALLMPVGVTLSSAFLGGLIVFTLLGGFGLSGLWWVTLMGAVVGALFGAIFSQTFIVIGSALQGGYLMVLSSLVLYVKLSGGSPETIRFDPMVSLLILTVALGIGLIGVVLQKRSLHLNKDRAIEPVLRRDGRPKIVSRHSHSYNRYSN